MSDLPRTPTAYLGTQQEGGTRGRLQFSAARPIKLSTQQEMTMHADPVRDEGGVSLTQEEIELLSELDVPGTQHAAHSLLSVLMPAKPPQPKNARIIRLFDYEAAKNDPVAGDADADAIPQADAPQNGAAPQSPAPVKPEPKNREAAKAARNQSLFAAARLG